MEARLHVVSSSLAYLTDPQVLSQARADSAGVGFHSAAVTVSEFLWNRKQNQRNGFCAWLLRTSRCNAPVVASTSLGPTSFFESQFTPPNFLDISQDLLVSCDSMDDTSAGRTEEVIQVIVAVFTALDEENFIGTNSQMDAAGVGSWRQILEWVEMQVKSLLRVLYKRKVPAAMAPRTVQIHTTQVFLWIRMSLATCFMAGAMQSGSIESML